MKQLGRRKIASFIYRSACRNLKEEIASIEELATCSAEELGRVKAHRLGKLMVHARELSPRYQRIIRHLPDLDRISVGLDYLAELPFLFDKDLRTSAADRSLFCSRPALRVTRKTAGTTGAPKVIEMDADAMARQWAVRAFFLKSIGVPLGGRELRLWGRSQGVRSVVLDSLINRQVVSAEELWDAQRAVGRRLFERGPWDYAYGYSSLMMRIAELWSSFGKGPAPFAAAIFTAEAMSDDQRGYASAVFQRPVVGEYGCTETDILAFGCVAGRYHLVEPNFIFEPIPVPEEPDAVELAVTDLNNFRTPLIRYRLGDLIEGLDTEPSCGCGLPWASFVGLRGRTADRIIRFPSGSVLHAGVFSRLAAVLPQNGIGFSRFLVEETAPGEFLMTLAGVADESREEARNILLRAVFERFGGLPPGSLRVQFGDIPQRAGSKFSYFIRSQEPTGKADSMTSADHGAGQGQG